MKKFIYSEDTTKATEKEEEVKMCGCGDDDPQFRAGRNIWYCEKCLKKLKTRFDKLLEEFYVYAEEYDVYNQQLAGTQEKSDRKI